MNENHRSIRSLAVFFVLSGLVLVLPLLMGNRTPMTLTTSGLVLVAGALLLALAGFATFPGRPVALKPPPTGWWIFMAVLTVFVALQVAPLEPLARAFGPYPDSLWTGDARPDQWSPNPAYSLRAWGTFVALFVIAWAASAMRSEHRGVLWLVVAASALFQALYGLASHAADAESIFGIWPRNTPDFVHGSFSNRNLFAGYLALTWPMVVAVWWRHSMPGIKRLPFELRVAGSVICGAIIGAALLGSASRLGSAAGLSGMLVGLVLWTRYRARLTRAAVWPMYATAFAALVAATWYGLAPLAERLASTSIGQAERLEVFTLMLTEMPLSYWLAGVGLGGFEAVFKHVQPGDMQGWYDYAHNDLLQWLLEMGLVGAGLLIAAVTALVRNARLTRETIPLYAGLVAISLVGLGDFSWHIPASQVIIALFLGVLLRKPPRKKPHGVREMQLRSV